MIFQVDEKGKSLSAYRSAWNPLELQLENYLISKQEDAPTIRSSVFGETLLLVSNQVHTRSGKRADILALDSIGNSVIIEIKRNRGCLGVETQALQYLADFSRYRGQAFIDRFSADNNDLKESIPGFLGDEVRIEDINKHSRIILMARSFDATLFSMGEWLSSRGVAFRCVEYTPIEYEGQRFLSFSVVFDRCPEAIFPLSFQSSTRAPAFFWHNIGGPTNDWWKYLLKTGQISTSFDGQPGDQGERILRKYIADDTIVAYASKYGALGYGVIRNPSSYVLLKPGCKEDVRNGDQLHRLRIEWKYAVAKIEDGISPARLSREYGLYHPVSTSARIDAQKARRLVGDMTDNTAFSAI